METIAVHILLLMWALTASVLIHDQQVHPETNGASYTPTTDYAALRMRGWTVLVNPSLDDDPQLRAETLELLDDHLYRITRNVPQPALGQLQEILVWVELDLPKTKCMCYHVSRDWLIPNGYNPDKEGGIEVGNARAFLAWTHQQPWMVLHELAHGYHDQVLGYDHAKIHTAWKDIKDQGAYERVLHINGQQRKHYALTNDKEYFAETTESFFGCNDFYPFVRGELRIADPQGHALMQELWLVDTH